MHIQKKKVGGVLTKHLVGWNAEYSLWKRSFFEKSAKGLVVYMQHIVICFIIIIFVGFTFYGESNFHRQTPLFD